MIKKCLIASLLILILFPTPSLAYFGAKYEPADGRIYHGLGQYVTFFYSDEENWQYVNEYQQGAEKSPIIYTAYYSINPKFDEFPYSTVSVNPNLADLINNHEYPYVILLGIAYLDIDATLAEIIGGNISMDDYYVNAAAVINGEWDSKIRALAQEIQQMGVPFLLRPGWEFGQGNSGVHQMGSSDFKDCWAHIQAIFIQEEVNNVAWVWNTVNPDQFNYLDYYPGDNQVDWWGINYFTTSQMSVGDGFLQAAVDHQKPVLIGESSPIHNGGTTNSANWNSWFVPYFNKIRNFNNIKAFVYISDPWDKAGFWNDWPDSRISSNEFIRQNYAAEMNSLIYIHMSEYLANPEVINGETFNYQDVFKLLFNYGKNLTVEVGYLDLVEDSKLNGLDFGLIWLEK
ncbi:hypothetical protein KKD62_03880 [Patescibacteria group bacterium]|nr:hypothetical protein [Patescibacteria group bacterium]MBU1931194.1 hypothetical protein [Patescibacteria group bacterium]